MLAYSQAYTPAFEKQAAEWSLGTRLADSGTCIHGSVYYSDVIIVNLFSFTCISNNVQLLIPESTSYDPE